MDRLGDDISRALSRAGVPDAGALAEIVRQWPGIVGDAIAQSAWPQRVSRSGTLHVATVSSTWAFELSRMAPEILERLRERFGTAAPPALRFAPGPVPAPAAPPQRANARRKLQPTAEEAGEACEIAAAISDEDMRQTLTRVIAASLASGRLDRRF